MPKTMPAAALAALGLAAAGPACAEPSRLDAEIARVQALGKIPGVAVATTRAGKVT